MWVFGINQAFRLFLLSISPFILFFASILIVQTNIDIFSQFSSLNVLYFLFVILIGLTFIPGLLQLELKQKGKFLGIKINLAHHPPALMASHEAFIFGQSFCLGCLGSLFGLVVGELILVVYILTPHLFTKFDLKFILLGSLLILFSYSRYYYQLFGQIRFLQHVSFFIGLSFLLITIDRLYHSIYVLVLFLPSWIAFLAIRAFLGYVDHKFQEERILSQ